MTTESQIYPPRLSRVWTAAALFLAAGVITTWSPSRAYWLWLHGAAAFPSLVSGIRIVSGWCALTTGTLAITGALRGLPQLAIMPRGIRLTTPCGTQWADWNSLGGFELETHRIGIIRRKVSSATAPIVGLLASRRLLRKKLLVIPDIFATPISSIAAEINARRSGAASIGHYMNADAASTTTARAQQFGLTGFRVPWVTIGIVAVILLTFVLEQSMAVEPSGPGKQVSVRTLLALGGLNRSLVIATGEWYRLLTAPLLHLNRLHLVLNCISLLIAGFILERLVGRAWFFALFVLGGLGGALTSLAVNPRELTSVGASGAIMCLFATGFICSFRLPPTIQRSRLQRRSIGVLVPSLLPMAASTTTLHIDYGAHLGGAVTGIMVGFLLLKKWPDTSRLPRLRLFAGGIAVTGLLLLTLSSVAIASRYGVYKMSASLIPANQLPKTKADAQVHAADLVARYPRDPRSHSYWAITLDEAHDYAAAEREVRTAPQLTEGMGPILTPQFHNMLRVMLARVLVERGDKVEAQQVARDVCHAPAAEQPAAPVQKVLADLHLCG